MDELRERTNPGFNTAKSTLVYLMGAGDENAATMARELHIEPDKVFKGRFGSGYDDERGCLL